MSQAILSTTEPIPSSVASKLRGLRTKITTWLLVDGLSRVLLVLVAAAAIHFVIDWWANLDLLQRLLLAAVGVVAVAFVAYKRLFVPLTTPVSDDALILAVEGHYGKELGESLISAVQFSRIRDVGAMGVSPQLVRASIDQGTRAAERVQFGGIIDSGWMLANLAILAVCGVLVLLGGYAVATTPEGDIWRRRLLGENVGYPQDTYLEVQFAQGDKLMIPRGDDWPLIVTVKEDSKTKPEEVWLDITSASGRRREKMEVVEKQRRFRWDLKNVIEPLKFQARTKGRGRTNEFQVVLVDRPAVEKLTLSKTFPKYAGGDTEALPAGMGPYHVLEGSSLTIKGTGNKPLSQATLIVGEKPVPLKVVGEREFTATIPADKLADGGYRIHLVDQESLPQPSLSQPGPLESNRPTRFTIRLKPDEAPNVAAKLHGISGMIVPQAMIPFDCFIKDEFAVMSVKLKHQWKPETAEEGTASTKGEADVEVVKTELKKRSMRFDDVFDIQPLKVEAGSGLSFLIEATDNNDGPYTGITIDPQTKDAAKVSRVQTDSPAAVADVQVGDVITEFDGQAISDPAKVAEIVRGKKPGDKVALKVTRVDKTAQPQTLDLELEISRRGIGKSTMFLLRVVTADELWSDLVRRQIEQRQDFERLHKNIDKYLTDCQALEADTRDAADLSTKQRQELLQLQKDHKLLATNIANVGGRLSLIVDEIWNNRLEEPQQTPIQDKLLKNVIGPMEQLAQGDVPQIIRQIDETRNNADSRDARNKALADVIAGQQRVSDMMKRILSNMEEAEGYQEAVQLLYDALKTQEAVRALTAKERERLIQEILEGREPAPDSPARDADGFKKLDENSDGNLSLDEFSKNAEDADLSTAEFRKLDTNSDSSLTQQEFTEK
jgi:hypothetical protein